MDFQDFYQRIEGRLDRLETKLDAHIERLPRAETDIHWLKQTGRALWAILIAIASKLAYSTLSH